MTDRKLVALPNIKKPKIIPLSELRLSKNQTKARPQRITPVANNPLKPGPYLGTRKPQSGVSVLIIDMLDSKDAKSVLLVE